MPRRTHSLGMRHVSPDPVHAAWKAHHPQASLPPGQDCGRCGNAEGATPVRVAVSKKFTAWDTWADPNASSLCPACSWGYQTASLRADTLEVTPASCRALTPSSLYDLLCRGPLRGDTLVSLPLRAGRRHVLPTAQFGRICLDGTNLTWSEGDTRRLRMVHQLRGVGVPWTAFTDPTPPWRALARSDDPAGLLGSWEQLSPWRENGLWLQVALAATHPERGRRAA